jgi:hypothetical protein
MSALTTAGLIFSGCANLKTTRSGFLGSYDKLGPVATDKHQLAYTGPQWPATGFSRVLLEPTVTRFDAKDTAKLTPQEPAELAAYCDAALRKAFAMDRAIAATPGPGTLRIRTALTGVDTSSPVLNAVTGVLLWPVDNGGVSLEFEALDGATDEQLAALVAYSEGTPLQVIGSFSRFGHAKSGIEKWVAELRSLINAASQPTPPVTAATPAD